MPSARASMRGVALEVLVVGEGHPEGVEVVRTRDAEFVHRGGLRRRGGNNTLARVRARRARRGGRWHGPRRAGRRARPWPTAAWSSAPSAIPPGRCAAGSRAPGGAGCGGGGDPAGRRRDGRDPGGRRRPAGALPGAPRRAGLGEPRDRRILRRVRPRRSGRRTAPRAPMPAPSRRRCMPASAGLRHGHADEPRPDLPRPAPHAGGARRHRPHRGDLGRGAGARMAAPSCSARAFGLADAMYAPVVHALPDLAAGARRRHRGPMSRRCGRIR